MWSVWAVCSLALLVPVVAEYQREEPDSVVIDGDGSASQVGAHRRRVGRAVNCKLSQWSEWGTCSTTCGSGEKGRQRVVLVQPALGGLECELPLQQSAPCPDDAEMCPVDCLLSEWAPWESCSKSCGGGSQVRSRRKLASQSFGGQACGTLAGSRECSNHPCPVDCKVTEWAEWTLCSKSCGGGTHKRARTVVSEAENRGALCPKLEDVGECKTDFCPGACHVSEWGSWTPCTRVCGGGEHDRHRTVTREAEHNGDPCPTLDDKGVCGTDACASGHRRRARNPMPTGVAYHRRRNWR